MSQTSEMGLEIPEFPRGNDTPLPDLTPNVIGDSLIEAAKNRHSQFASPEEQASLKSYDTKSTQDALLPEEKIIGTKSDPKFSNLPVLEISPAEDFTKRAEQLLGTPDFNPNTGVQLSVSRNKMVDIDQATANREDSTEDITNTEFNRFVEFIPKAEATLEILKANLEKSYKTARASKTAEELVDFVSSHMVKALETVRSLELGIANAREYLLSKYDYMPEVYSSNLEDAEKKEFDKKK